MIRWMLILAVTSVAAVVLAFVPDADAGGYGRGNQVFVNQFGQVVQVQSGFHQPQVFVHRSFGNQVFVRNGFGYGNRVFVQRPQVQVQFGRGFNGYGRGFGFGPRFSFQFR